VLKGNEWGQDKGQREETLKEALQLSWVEKIWPVFCFNRRSNTSIHSLLRLTHYSLLCFHTPVPSPLGWELQSTRCIQNQLVQPQTSRFCKHPCTEWVIRKVQGQGPLIPRHRDCSQLEQVVSTQKGAPLSSRTACLDHTSLSKHLKGSNQTVIFFFIHMCIQGLGQVSPLPPAPPWPPTPPPLSPPIPSIPSRNYFALISNFVEERV
jgi:hypothetical protein